MVKKSVERLLVILQLELAFDPLKDPQYYSLFAIFQLTLQHTTVAIFFVFKVNKIEISIKLHTMFNFQH